MTEDSLVNCKEVSLKDIEVFHPLLKTADKVSNYRRSMTKSRSMIYNNSQGPLVNEFSLNLSLFFNELDLFFCLVLLL